MFVRQRHDVLRKLVLSVQKAAGQSRVVRIDGEIRAITGKPTITHVEMSQLSDALLNKYNTGLGFQR